MTIWLVSMGSLFLTFFVGMEQMHLQFLPTFAVNTELNLSPSTAAMMSSAAALAFTVGRCLSIPLAIKLRPQTILYSNHILMLTGTMILAVYANSSETMLWLGNVILGLGFSSVYASIYAFLENQFRVTNRVGSIFVFAGGLTAAVSPSLVGQYIEASPLILVWFNLVCCLLCLSIMFIIHFTVYMQNKKHGGKSYKEGKGLKVKTMMDDDDENGGDGKTQIQLIEDGYGIGAVMYAPKNYSCHHNQQQLTGDQEEVARCLVEDGEMSNESTVTSTSSASTSRDDEKDNKSDVVVPA